MRTACMRDYLPECAQQHCYSQDTLPGSPVLQGSAAFEYLGPLGSGHTSHRCAMQSCTAGTAACGNVGTAAGAGEQQGPAQPQKCSGKQCGGTLPAGLEGLGPPPQALQSAQTPADTCSFCVIVFLRLYQTEQLPYQTCCQGTSVSTQTSEADK